MAVLTYQEIGFAGANVTLQTPGAFDLVDPDDRGFFIVRNGSGASITATVDIPGNSEWGQALADSVVSVPAGADRLIGPLDPRISTPVAMVCSSTTSILVAAVRLGPVMPGLPT